MKYYILQTALFLMVALMMLAFVYSVTASYISQPPLNLGYLIAAAISLIGAAVSSILMVCFKEERQKKKNPTKDSDFDKIS